MTHVRRPLLALLFLTLVSGTLWAQISPRVDPLAISFQPKTPSIGEPVLVRLLASVCSTVAAGARFLEGGLVTEIDVSTQPTCPDSQLIPHLVSIGTPRSLAPYWEVRVIEHYAFDSSEVTRLRILPREARRTLPLHGATFEARVHFADPPGKGGGGQAGEATAITLQGEQATSGLFWFFDESNWEVLLKVLGGQC